MAFDWGLSPIVSVRVGLLPDSHSICCHNGQCQRGPRLWCLPEYSVRLASGIRIVAILQYTASGAQTL